MQAPFVAATVVRAQSPTSVRAGDSAIVRPDGTIEGFVGGTCAEASVRLYSLRAMESGEPVLLRILPGAAEGQPEAEEGSVTVKNPCLSGGALEVFLEPHLPAPTMRVVGSAPIAIALADLARRVGYAVESGQADLARPSAGRRRGGRGLTRSRRGAGAHRGASGGSPVRGPGRQRGSRPRRARVARPLRARSALGCTRRRDSRSAPRPRRRSRSRSSRRSSR